MTIGKVRKHLSEPSCSRSSRRHGRHKKRQKEGMKTGSGLSWGEYRNWKKKVGIGKEPKRIQEPVEDFNAVSRIIPWSQNNRLVVSSPSFKGTIYFDLCIGDSCAPGASASARIGYTYWKVQHVFVCKSCMKLMRRIERLS